MLFHGFSRARALNVGPRDHLHIFARRCRIGSISLQPTQPSILGKLLRVLWSETVREWSIRSRAERAKLR